MSGWTIVTLRGKEATDYEYSRWDSHDPAHAVEDICATVDEDSRVRDWTLDSPHVYIYLNAPRYGWEAAEEFIKAYEEMVEDAVVLGANDTTDTGTARYYEVHAFGGGADNHTDEYKETQSEDGTYVGQIALSVINARHGILARDPFHDWLGRFDERYADEGTNRLDE